MPERSHPFPSRTRKLSSPGPMVLQAQACGRVGRCWGFEGPHPCDVGLHLFRPAHRWAAAVVPWCRGAVVPLPVRHVAWLRAPSGLCVRARAVCGDAWLRAPSGLCVRARAVCGDAWLRAPSGLCVRARAVCGDAWLRAPSGLRARGCARARAVCGDAWLRARSGLCARARAGCAARQRERPSRSVAPVRAASWRPLSMSRLAVRARRVARGQTRAPCRQCC
jgi:hypothetical protein